MSRFLGAIVLGCLALAFSGVSFADDKKDAKEITIKGTACCAMCELGIEKKCATVIKVKDGSKETVYYLDEASNKKFPHKKICKTTIEVEATAKVTEKDGKKWITISKIEEKKS